MATRKYRPTIELPEELVEQVSAVTDRRGVHGGIVWHYLITTAAIAVLDGRGHLLPRGDRAPRGSRGTVAEARWTQGAAEFRDAADLIHSAGSSPTAVLREGGAMYVEYDGDLLRMPWLRSPGQRR